MKKLIERLMGNSRHAEQISPLPLGGATHVVLPNDIGQVSPLPLGEGRILNELASCKNSGEGDTHVVYLSTSKTNLPQPSLTKGGSRKAAFTLAEVLITLGIIGVVAALTLPSLIQNYQKQALASQTKKFYSMMSQAVKQYMADEGVDDLRNTPLTDMSDDGTGEGAAQKACDDFIQKYLKVAKVCEDGCFADTYITQTGETSPYLGRAYDYLGKFVLADGTVLDIVCGTNTTPIGLLLDINGKKGPNKIGYDFWTMNIYYDGSIDESYVNPECKKGKPAPESGQICVYDITQEEAREVRFDSCKNDNNYGGCFGHFLENNFTFDY